MTEQPFVDPGHILPDEDWAKVVARAQEIRTEVQETAGGGASGPGGIVLDMTALGIRSRKYFPVSGRPTQLLVLHSAECPLKGGYAKSLSEWACGTIYPADPVASWQRFVDPIHRVRLVPDELGAWAASEANPLSISWEQAGYARYTREQWLSADGRVQMEMLALDMAEVALRDGIPARWLTDWEVRQILDHDNRDIKGFCNHRQIDPETRTDPGDGYPYDLLMERIKAYMAGEETDMPLTPEDHKAIAREVWGFANPELDPRDMRQIVADIETQGKASPAAIALAVWGFQNPDLDVRDMRQVVADVGAGVADLMSRPAVDIAAQLDAAGIAADVRDELVKLLEGRANG